MVVDIQRLLVRVVTDVIGSDAHAAFHALGRPHDWRVELRSTHDSQRQADLRATYEWCQVSVPDLGVGVTLFAYDDDEDTKEAPLRELAMVVRAHLRGEGSVEYKRGPLGRRPVLTVEANDRVWRLGRRVSSGFAP